MKWVNIDKDGTGRVWDSDINDDSSSWWLDMLIDFAEFLDNIFKKR